MPFPVPPPDHRRHLLLSRRALMIVGLGALPLPGWAEPADPAAPIHALYTGLGRLMREGSATPFAARFREVAPVIDQAFDLRDILMRSVGLHWANLTEPVRGKLFDTFRTFIVATYVANFDHYDGERFEVLPDRRAVGADRVVATRIVPGTGNPIRIDYVMRQIGDGWRVQDVLLDGTISRVAVQRSDFRALLAKGGAEALIDSLQQKIADLSGGAPLGS